VGITTGSRGKEPGKKACDKRPQNYDVDDGRGDSNL
jgi:hypothetical protein